MTIFLIFGLIFQLVWYFDHTKCIFLHCTTGGLYEEHEDMLFQTYFHWTWDINPTKIPDTQQELMDLGWYGWERILEEHYENDGPQQS